jgi:hypothetical protein
MKIISCTLVSENMRTVVKNCNLSAGSDALQQLQVYNVKLQSLQIIWYQNSFYT